MSKAPYPTQLSYESKDYNGPTNASINGTPVVIHRLIIEQGEGDYNEVTLTLKGVQITASDPEESA